MEKLTWPVPVAVLPFALRLVVRRLLERADKPVLRLGKMKDGPVITDNGNFVMDVDFGMIEDPKGLAARISPIPRVVEHGIFDNLDELYLAKAGAVEIIGRGEEAKRIFEEHSRPLPINFPKIMIYLRALCASVVVVVRTHWL